MKGMSMIVLIFLFCLLSYTGVSAVPVTEIEWATSNQHQTSISIALAENTKSAVFMYDKFVYVVLNEKSDERILTTTDILDARSISHPSATIWRLLPAPKYTINAERKKNALTLTVSRQKQESPLQPIIIQKWDNALSFDIEEGAPITFIEPMTGEKIVVFPTALSYQRMPHTIAGEMFLFLQTIQGLVLIPRTEDIATFYRHNRLWISSEKTLCINQDIPFNIRKNKENSRLSDYHTWRIALEQKWMTPLQVASFYFGFLDLINQDKDKNAIEAQIIPYLIELDLSDIASTITKANATSPSSDKDR